VPIPRSACSEIVQGGSHAARLADFCNREKRESYDHRLTLHTLIALGKTPGLETLAEGIEDPAQLEILKYEQCDLGQGYLFARPLIAEDIQGPTAGGIIRLNPAEFVLPRVGTYSVDFSVSVTEPGQLVIALDSGGGMVELPYAVYGRATGTSQIAGDALITTTAASSTVELRNPAGNTPALTITPLAGGAQPAVASIVI
jgi:hypothetical protein